MDANERARLRERQWPEEHAVDDGEDGARRADAERQREHGDQRERRRLRQLPNGEPSVAQSICQHEACSGPPGGARVHGILNRIGEPHDLRPRVRAIGVADVDRQTAPVRDLRRRVRLRLVLAGARDPGLAVEVFELRRELADNPRFAFG